jgi:uncharacterized repeat protein (TIGR01451 family)
LSKRSRAVLICCASLCGVIGAPGLAAALPAVQVSEVTTPLTSTTAHTGVTVTAPCPSGSTMVGGGSYLRNATDPSTLPTNGLVLGGQSPSTGTTPVDEGVADGTTNPSNWFTNANFTGVADPADLDQAEAFALCATGGTANTVVATASTSGADDNANQQVSPPVLAIATCPANTELIGGGAVTTTPDQVNDGTTVGNEGNLKPLGSYPSDINGAPAADGSTAATSWSAYGSAGIQNGGGGPDVVTAYALCSTDPSPPAVEVARVDVDGPVAQPGTTTTTGSATCPSGTQLIGGGYSADETVGATSGLQPQQGYHMRGSYPSTSAATSSGGTPPSEVANGATDPEIWTALLQLGGQTLPAGDYGTLHVFAMCAMAPPPPDSADLSASLAASPNPVVVGQPLTYTLGVANAGPADATGVVATEDLPADVTFDSATSTAGSCAQAAGTVTCSIGALADGDSATATIVVTPTEPVALTADATVSGDQTDPSSANNSATNTTMADLATRATTALTASPANGTLGGTITDPVTLAGGSNPAGTIAFNLYGPGDTTCTLALATSTATVAGNGAYSSAPYTATTAGTYRWVASYSGDGANAPASAGACGAASQTISVLAVPTLTVKASGSGTVGAVTSAEATLAGGTVVTGSIAVSLYGPGDTTCTHALARTTAAVSGNGIYGATPFTTTVAGTYRWVASYSGDALNVPVSTACGAAGTTVTVAAAPAPPAAPLKFKVATPKTTGKGRISLAVTSPGQGQFRALATVSVKVAGKKKPKQVRYGTRTLRVVAAGRFTLTIVPDAQAKALFRKHRKLSVTIAVRFTPHGGKPQTRTIRVTVKETKEKV